MKFYIILILFGILIKISNSKILQKLSTIRKLKHLKSIRVNCNLSDCYPQTNDLLLGRSKFLYASSTCGLTQPEHYCILGYKNKHNLTKDPCFVCDSKSNSSRLSHRIENIIYKNQPLYDTKGREIKKTWWQSEKEIENVFIQFDLESLMTMTHLIMKFKSLPPAAMLIEKSTDYGVTWYPQIYYAFDCDASFPGVSKTNLKNFKKPFCTKKYSGLEISSGAELYYAPLLQLNNKSIDRATLQDILKITNLRLNFSKFHSVEYDLKHYFYAVSEVKLIGSCLCNGHSSECIQTSDRIEYDPKFIKQMMHSKCKCQHNTDGDNCEKCLPMYNDQPWRPASNENKNACKKCKCNSHAKKCIFDSELYNKTNGKTGGRCECLHNTGGFNCEKCKNGYYRDPNLPFNSTNTCKKCTCDLLGTLQSNDEFDVMCTSEKCICKVNVEGNKCEKCKNGYWNLNLTNGNLGCQKCECSIEGTINNLGCNKTTGECMQCKKNVQGIKCDKCKPGYYGLNSQNPDGCLPCNCSPFSYSNDCNENGQCSCKPRITGKKCDQIEKDHFCPNLDYQTFEAEYVSRLNENSKLSERYDKNNKTWTGQGFMRVFNNGHIKFHLNNILVNGLYDIVLRFEPSNFIWHNITFKMINKGIDMNLFKEKYKPFIHSSNCTYPVQYLIENDHMLFDPKNKTYIILFKNYCFDKFNFYELELKFRHDHSKSATSALKMPSILVDSIVLIPNLKSEHEEYEECKKEYYGLARHNPRCAKIISYSLIDTYGIYPCDCNQVGASTSACNAFGGQCNCKTNINNRQCDSCLSNSWGFSSNGCQLCNCDPIGSKNDICDKATGQCMCHSKFYGKKCNQCIPGYYNFPICKKCECNGFADMCTSDGICIGCSENTDGFHCDQCKIGYFGDPLLGIPCKKCLCPSVKGNNFANSCSLKKLNGTLDLICKCYPGYMGDRCEKCAPFYYGDPLKPGGSCNPCDCNGNIDPNNPVSCDSISGECKECLFNTEGFNCEQCKIGYYGNALKQECRPCDCNLNGTERNCGTNCDRETGVCRCLPNVVGRRCDECATGHWNIESGIGCIACNCDTTGTYENSTECDELDGKCNCLPTRSGKRCNECPEGTFGDPKVGCKNCNCTSVGSDNGKCDKKTGECLCLPRITGKYCDTCQLGSFGNAPLCYKCGECFDQWNKIITNLKIELFELEAITLNKINELDNFKDESLIPKFYAEYDRLKENLNDIRHILDKDYEKEKISNILKNLTCVDDDMARIKKNFNKKISQIEEWTENRQLKEKKKEYNLINNETTLLLNEVLAFNDLFNSGESIYKSNEISIRSFQKASKTLNEFKIEMSQIIDEIQTKSYLPWDDLKMIDSIDMQSLVNQTLKDLNYYVCGAQTFDCNHQCGASSCGKCGKEFHDDIDLNEDCSNGLFTSYNKLNYFNGKAVKIYNETEKNLKNSMEKIRSAKTDAKLVKNEIDDLKTNLNQTKISINEFKGDLKKLLNESINYELNYNLLKSKIDLTLNETLNFNLSTKEIELNSTFNQIQEFSKKDLKSVIYLVNLQIVPEHEESLMIKNKITNKLNNINSSKQELNLTTQIINEYDISYNIDKKNLENISYHLKDVNHTATNIKKTLKRIKTKFDNIDQKKLSIEIPINTTHENIINLNMNKIKQSNYLLKQLSLTLKQVKNQLRNFENKVLNINVINGLDQNTLNILLNLQSKLIQKKEYFKDKEAKLKELDELNELIDVKLQFQKQDVLDLKKQAQKLKESIFKKVKFCN